MAGRRGVDSSNERAAAAQRRRAIGRPRPGGGVGAGLGGPPWKKTTRAWAVGGREGGAIGPWLLPSEGTPPMGERPEGPVSRTRPAPDCSVERGRAASADVCACRYGRRQFFCGGRVVFFAGHLICISTPRQRPVPASSDDRQLGRPSSETAARRPHRRRDEAPPGQRRRRLQRRRRRRRDQRRLPVADARRRRRCRQRRRVQRRRRRPRHAVQSEERRRRRRQERRRRRRRSLLLHFGYFKSPTGGASDVDDAGVIHRYHHRIHSKIKLSTDLQYIFTTRIRSFRGFCPGFT